MATTNNNPAQGNTNAPTVPWWKNPRVLIIIVLVYLMMPIDLIPDVIPLIGELDDLAVVFAAFKMLVKYHEEEKERALELAQNA